MFWAVGAGASSVSVRARKARTDQAFVQHECFCQVARVQRGRALHRTPRERAGRPGEIGAEAWSILPCVQTGPGPQTSFCLLAHALERKALRPPLSTPVESLLARRAAAGLVHVAQSCT